MWFKSNYMYITRQHPTKQQLYDHLPPITKTIRIRRTRYAGHCWRRRDELICDVLLWTPSHGRAKARRPARTYIQQLCEDTESSPEDLPEAMTDREKWRRKGQGSHHHPQVALIARSALTLPRHPSLSSWLSAGLRGCIQYPYRGNICIYQPPPHGQDVTQGQFLSRDLQVWIESFLSFRLVA